MGWHALSSEGRGGFADHALRYAQRVPPLLDLRHYGDLMAWLFDGVDDYVTIAPDAALALGEGDWTIAGWVHITSNAGTAYMYFLSWNDVMTINSCNWYFNEAGIANPNELRFYVRDNDGDYAAAMSAGAPGASSEWQHLLLRRSDATFAQYINGAIDGTGYSGSFGKIDPAQPLHLGGRNDHDPDRFFNGAMAEWAKWDRALSTGEIAALVAGAAPGNIPTGLAWYLPMLDYQERIVGLTIANHGSALVDPPPGIISLASHRVARAEVFLPQAAAAELFTAGTVAGQTHEH